MAEQTGKMTHTHGTQTHADTLPLFYNHQLI